MTKKMQKISAFAGLEATKNGNKFKILATQRTGFREQFLDSLNNSRSLKRERAQKNQMFIPMKLIS